MVDFEAADWYSFGEDAVDAVAVGLSLEGEVVAPVGCYLQADLLLSYQVPLVVRTSS